jgi:hypothetical protein
MSGDKDKGDADKISGWLGDEQHFYERRPYFIQNEYFDFTSKCSGEKRMKRYILEK